MTTAAGFTRSVLEGKAAVGPHDPRLLLYHRRCRIGPRDPCLRLPCRAAGRGPGARDARGLGQADREQPHFLFDFEGSNSVFLVTDDGVLLISPIRR
jgi:hypothetical protein